jgi:hypothetical protein
VENQYGQKRNVQTNPLTNYNILVLDQTLKNNSSVSLINTCVLRKGKDYDSDVSALVFNVYNKKNVYNWNGKIAFSNIFNNGGKTVSGYMHNLGFGKVGGRFNFQLNEELTSKNYNPNDLGILFNNNYLDHYLYIGYNWNKPGKWYNQLHLNNNFSYSRRVIPEVYQSFHYNGNINGQLKNLAYVGMNLNYLAKGNDFYEPRVPDRFYKTPSGFNVDGWVQTNSAKKFYVLVDAEIGFSNLFNNRFYNRQITNNYRFNDKFSIGHVINLNPSFNDAGFADISGAEIIFSKRDRKTIENILTSKYNFNRRNGITFRLRHYWSEVMSKEFYTLRQDGSLLKNSIYNGNTNQNLNIFNIDMVYT